MFAGASLTVAYQAVKAAAMAVDYAAIRG